MKDAPCAGTVRPHTDDDPTSGRVPWIPAWRDRSPEVPYGRAIHKNRQRVWPLSETYVAKFSDSLAPKWINEAGSFLV